MQSASVTGHPSLVNDSPLRMLGVYKQQGFVCISWSWRMPLCFCLLQITVHLLSCASLTLGQGKFLMNDWMSV